MVEGIKMLAGMVGFNFKFGDLKEFIKMLTFKQHVMFLANFVKLSYEAGDLGSSVYVFWM